MLLAAELARRVGFFLAVSAAAKSSVPRSRLGASERPALRECWLRHDSSVAPRVGKPGAFKVEFRQDRNCSARGRRERSASRPRRTARPPLPRSARARPAAGWRARPGPRRGPLARGQRPQRLGLVGVEDERPEAVGVGSAELAEHERVEAVRLRGGDPKARARLSLGEAGNRRSASRTAVVGSRAENGSPTMIERTANPVPLSVADDRAAPVSVIVTSPAVAGARVTGPIAAPASTPPSEIDAPASAATTALTDPARSSGMVSSSDCVAIRGRRSPPFERSSAVVVHSRPAHANLPLSGASVSSAKAIVVKRSGGLAARAISRRTRSRCSGSGLSTRKARGMRVTSTRCGRGNRRARTPPSSRGTPLRLP